MMQESKCLISIKQHERRAIFANRSAHSERAGLAQGHTARGAGFEGGVLLAARRPQLNVKGH
jgi:hypothetical protein